MSDAAQQLLAAFDALPGIEREAVFAELLTRCPFGEGTLSDASLVELADEVFQCYDAEEAGNATRPTG